MNQGVEVYYPFCRRIIGDIALAQSGEGNIVEATRVLHVDRQHATLLPAALQEVMSLLNEGSSADPQKDTHRALKLLIWRPSAYRK